MLRDIMKAVFEKPVTETYPFERVETPPTLRGKLVWTPGACTGCALCVKDCPADAIHLITLDKAAKRFVMEYHEDRCIFCGQCVQSCRFDCLTLQNDDWELATATRSGFTVWYGAPEDVAAVVQDSSPPDRESP